MQKRSCCAADSRLVGQETRQCTGTYKFITVFTAASPEHYNNRYEFSYYPHPRTYKDYSFNTILVISYLNPRLKRFLAFRLIP